jgi:hypothetical protein
MLPAFGFFVENPIANGDSVEMVSFQSGGNGSGEFGDQDTHAEEGRR